MIGLILVRTSVRNHLFVQSFIGLALVAFVSLPAGWAEEEKKGEQHGACRAEVEKLCPDKKRGPELMKCVEEHLSEFSSECQEHHKKRQENREAIQEACKADEEKFCKDMKVGKGLLKCMKKHESEFSEGCRSAIKEHGKKHKRGKKGRSHSESPESK